jgi:hypothetical protein
MSTAALEVGGSPAGLLYFSASQFDTLTTCEQRWLYNKTLPRGNFASSDAMDLGTLIHTLEGAWWGGKDWRRVWLKEAAEYMKVPQKDLAWRMTQGKAPRLVEAPKGWGVPTIFLRAKKIMEAWEEVHGVSPEQDEALEALDARDLRETLPGLAGAELVALELPFDLPIPGVKDARVRGFMDGLVSIPAPNGVRVHATTKILEFKTMGRWGKEDRVWFDPQLLLYLWAARQLFGVESAVFEAISTYDYKDGPATKRFKRIELPYDQRAIDRLVDDLQRQAKRARQILKNPGLAIRNVGEACTYCDHQQACLRPWET